MVINFREPDSEEENLLEEKVSSHEASRSYHTIFIKLSNSLKYIKDFPWFSVLLVVLLTWSSYQIATRSKSSHAVWVQNPVKSLNENLRTLLPTYLHKKTECVKKEVVLEKTVPKRLKTLEQPGLQKTSVIDSQEYERRITDLEEYLKSTQTTLTQLQEAKHILEKELDSLKTQLGNTHKALNAQAQQLSEINLKIASLSAPSEEPKESRENVTQGYSVYAIIQGRAWLNTPQGKILTVRVGSILPPFGVVQQIDMDNRLVYFDQGHVISPSESDS